MPYEVWLVARQRTSRSQQVLVLSEMKQSERLDVAIAITLALILALACSPHC